jgi:hypothetical protein
MSKSSNLKPHEYLPFASPPPIKSSTIPRSCTNSSDESETGSPVPYGLTHPTSHGITGICPYSGREDTPFVPRRPHLGTSRTGVTLPPDNNPVSFYPNLPIYTDLILTRHNLSTTTIKVASKHNLRPVAIFNAIVVLMATSIISLLDPMVYSPVIRVGMTGELPLLPLRTLTIAPRPLIPTTYILNLHNHPTTCLAPIPALPTPWDTTALYSHPLSFIQASPCRHLVLKHTFANNCISLLTKQSIFGHFLTLLPDKGRPSLYLY